MSGQETVGFDKLFTPLPPALGGSGDRGRKETIVQFLQQAVPASDQKEIESELVKNLPLAQQPKKSRPKAVRKKGKGLSATQKRQLGLFKLKGPLEFQSFKKLHYLWRDYMREVIDVSKIPRSPERPPDANRLPAILDEQLQLRICRADFHGAFLKVTRAVNTSLLGLQGLVAMETRNTFRLLTKKNEVKEVPKQGTVFTLLLDGLLISVSGSSFIMKPSERAVKKWKRKPTFELC